MRTVSVKVVKLCYWQVITRLFGAKNGKYLVIYAIRRGDKMKKRVTIHLLPVFLLTIFFFCGCAGYKKGYYSCPYSGDIDTVLHSPTSSYEMNRSKVLNFKNCQIYVSLKNEIQTSDMTYFLLLPVPESLQDEPQYNQSAPFFYISLAVRPEVDGIALDPGKIMLIVDRIKRVVKETRVTAGEGIINYWYYGSDRVRQLPLAQGGKILLDQDKWNYFAVYFNGQVPFVDQDIQLDLSEAISLPDDLPVPVIRFKKVRYGKWYG
jgi:hypothetical protein